MNKMLQGSLEFEGQPAVVKKFKRGEVRADGMVFYQVQRKGNWTKDLWVTKSEYEVRLEDRRKWRLERLNALKKSFKKWSSANRSHINRYKKELRERDIDSSRAKERKCYLKHIDRKRESARKSWAKHKEKRTAYFQRWVAVNRKRTRDNALRWARENPGKASERNARYRTRTINQRPELTAAQKSVMNEIYLQSSRVSKCTGIKFHVDHIMPIAKGGIHAPWNLRPLPSVINLRKGSRLS